MKKILSITAALVFLSPAAHADIVSPMAPPELGDTLKDFRTKEQLQERSIIEFATGHAVDVKVEEPVLATGKSEAGLLRLSSSYMAGQDITVPQYGSSLIRFYDMHGNPWDIVRVELENQGYTATVTASPSELLIKRRQGAAGSKMTVRLANLMQPLIFNLNALSLLKNEQSIKVILNSVKVNYVSDRKRPYDLKKIEFAKVSPFEKTQNSEDIDFAKLRETMAEALLELKQ